MLATLTSRPPALLTHPSVRSPFLAGLRHPAIFLPTTYDTDFDPTALRAILAHELAHLARRDNAWTLAARLLSALLWPQPLLWVLCRRLEQIGEEACDQAVLAQDCPPRAYADCLLTLAERHPLERRERALGAGVAPFRSSLGQRIGRILDKGTYAMSAVTPRLRLTAALLAVAATLGGEFLVSSAPAPAYSAGGSAPRYVKPASGVPPRQAQAAMSFLDAHIRECELGSRAAGMALFVYKAEHHPATTQSQRELADLTRRYSSTADLWATLMKKKQDLEMRMRLGQLISEHKGGAAEGAQTAPSDVEPVGLLPTMRVASEPKTIPDWTKFTGNHLPMNTTDLHCYINMKQIALAIWGYTYHHNDRFPDADRWMDEIKPYLKTEEYYHDPAAPASERYSYAYNRNLSGAASDRVSNMSGTVMLFESSLNVRNASDTGQSLITPPRHAGHQNFVFVNIGGPAGRVRPSFALHVAPPGFYATASPTLLAEAQKRTLARLASEQSALPRVNQEFEGELRQALPQANSSNLTQARNLEMSIGLQVMGLQNIQKFRNTPPSKRPSALSSDWQHAERWTESQLRPLLAQEARLLPGVPGPQLTRLHSVAASLTILRFNVMFSQSEIIRLNKETQRRRQPNVNP